MCTLIAEVISLYRVKIWWTSSRGHWTESHQISTRGTEMIADYSAEIKIAIFQSVWKRQGDEWRLSSNCGCIAAKIARFNSINSEITARKFTKFRHVVAWLLPLNLLKADLRSTNALSNAEAKSKFVPCNVCEHLPYLTCCHSKRIDPTWKIIPTNTPIKPAK